MALREHKMMEVIMPVQLSCIWCYVVVCCWFVISSCYDFIILAAFNDYVHLTGCTRSKRPATIGDDTPLLHLLSYFVDGEQGNDLLYCVIADVVSSFPLVIQ